MTVQKLIEELQQCDTFAEVYWKDYDNVAVVKHQVVDGDSEVILDEK